jgi:hypothetical protein
VEVAPVEVGVTLGGVKVTVPQGLVLEVDWQTVGLGEIFKINETDSAVPLVRVAVTVTDVDPPTTMVALPGFADNA